MYQSCVRCLNNEKWGGDYTGILCNNVETFLNLKLFFERCLFTAFNERRISRITIISDILLFAHICFLLVAFSFCLRYSRDMFWVKISHWWACCTFCLKGPSPHLQFWTRFCLWGVHFWVDSHASVYFEHVNLLQFPLALILARSLQLWVCFVFVCLLVCLFVLRQSLTLWPRPALNLKSSCHTLLSTRITSMCPRAQFPIFYFCQLPPVYLFRSVSSIINQPWPAV